MLRPSVGSLHGHPPLNFLHLHGRSAPWSSQQPATLSSHTAQRVESSISPTSRDARRSHQIEGQDGEGLDGASSVWSRRGDSSRVPVAIVRGPAVKVFGVVDVLRKVGAKASVLGWLARPGAESWSARHPVAGLTSISGCELHTRCSLRAGSATPYQAAAAARLCGSDPSYALAWIKRVSSLLSRSRRDVSTTRLETRRSRGVPFAQ